MELIKEIEGKTFSVSVDYSKRSGFYLSIMPCTLSDTYNSVQVSLFSPDNRTFILEDANRNSKKKIEKYTQLVNDNWEKIYECYQVEENGKLINLNK